MKISVHILVGVMISFLFCVSVQSRRSDLDASSLLEQYFALPLSTDGYPGEARRVRISILQQLAATGEEAVFVIRLAMPIVEDPVHKQELIEALGWIPTTSAAVLAVSYRKDADQKTRSTVLHCLRRLSLRVNRRAHVVPRGPDFPPKVEGLLPYIIEFLDDSEPMIRWAALLALADTREAEAIGHLRLMLNDKETFVRVYAACLLTEMDDFSGVSELHAELERVVGGDPSRLPTAGYLVTALERVTGENLGKVPMNPMLHSSVASGRKAAEDTRVLLSRWLDWWAVHGTKYE